MPENLTIELLVEDGKADVVIGRNKQKLQEFVRDVERLQPNIKFNIPNQNYIDLDKLEKRAAETRKSFEDIAKTRLDSGNIGMLTKEVIKAQERSRILASDISNIKKELANPNRKSSIAFLTDELRAAEKEADMLNRKLQTLGGKNAVDGFTRRGSSQGLNLSSFQKTNLFYQANDVATMAAMGANPTQIIASQAGQIAQIFSPEQASLLVAKFASLIPIVTAGAAAIALTYKITGDLRAEAERKLSIEEKINSAINKQILASKELVKNYELQQKLAQSGRDFDRFLDENNNFGGLQGLIDRKKQLEVFASVKDLDDKESQEVAKQMREQALRLGEAIAIIQQSEKDAPKRAADNAMRLRWEGFVKQQEFEKESEKRRLEAQEKFQKSVEQGKDKVKDFEKTFISLYDNINSRFYAQNPIALAMIEGEKATRQLQETLKTLPPELQEIGKKALAMQESLNADNLFRARLDNRLQAFDLQDQAETFRKFRDELKIENPTKFFDDYIKFYSDKLSKETTNQLQQFAIHSDGGTFRLDNRPFVGYARHSDGGTSQYDLRNELLYVFDQVANGGTIRRNRNFDDLTEFEKRQYLSEVNKTDTQNNLSLQERLNKQLAIIDSFGANATPEQLAIANQKIIQLTQGTDPRSLTQYQRDQAALAREREAERLVRNEQEAKEEREADRKTREKLVNVLNGLEKVVEKLGKEGLDIRVKDDTANKKVSNIEKRPTSQDVVDYYSMTGTKNGLTNK